MYTAEPIACNEIPKERSKHPGVELHLGHAKLKAWKEVANKTKSEENILVFHMYLDETTIFLWAQGMCSDKIVYSRSYYVALSDVHVCDFH